MAAAIHPFAGRFIPHLRRSLHLILHHLAVHLHVSTSSSLPPRLSDTGRERPLAPAAAELHRNRHTKSHTESAIDEK